MRPQHRARRWAGPALGAEELPALAGCARRLQDWGCRGGGNCAKPGLLREGCSPSGREQENGKALTSSSLGSRWEGAAFPREAEDGAKSPAWPQGIPVVLGHWWDRR